MNHNTTLSFQHCYELQSNIIHYTFIIAKNLPINAVVSSSLWRSLYLDKNNAKGVRHVPEQTLLNIICEGMCRTPTHCLFTLNAVVCSSLWRSFHPNHANTKRPQHVPEQTL